MSSLHELLDEYTTALAYTDDLWRDLDHVDPFEARMVEGRSEGDPHTQPDHQGGLRLVEQDQW